MKINAQLDMMETIVKVRLLLVFGSFTQIRNNGKGLYRGDRLIRTNIDRVRSYNYFSQSFNNNLKTFEM